MRTAEVELMNQGDILKQYGIEQVERHNTDFVAIMRGVAVDFATIHNHHKL